MGCVGVDEGVRAHSSSEQERSASEDRIGCQQRHLAPGRDHLDRSLVQHLALRLLISRSRRTGTGLDLFSWGNH